jgi:hypothetical protein
MLNDFDLKLIFKLDEFTPPTSDKLNNVSINKKLESFINDLKHHNIEELENSSVGISTDLSFDAFFEYLKEYFAPENINAYFKVELRSYANGIKMQSFEYKKPTEPKQRIIDDERLWFFKYIYNLFDLSPLFHSCENKNCFFNSHYRTTTNENENSNDAFIKRFNVSTSTCVPEIFKKPYCKTLVPNHPKLENVQEVLSSMICISHYFEKVRVALLMFAKIYLSEIKKIFHLSNVDNENAIKDLETIYDFEMDLSKMFLQDVIKICQYFYEKAAHTKDHKLQVQTKLFSLVEDSRKNLVQNIKTFVSHSDLQQINYVEKLLEKANDSNMS